MSLTGYRLWAVSASRAPVPPGHDFLLRSLVKGTVYWPTERPLRALPCGACYLQGEDVLDEYGQWQRRTRLFAVDQKARDPLERSFRACSCGIHAVLDSGDLVAYAEDVWSCWTVLGEVRLWGKVMPHERGYRAEYAQVAALYTLGTLTESVQRAHEQRAAAYGVPLLRVEDQPWGEKWVNAIAHLLPRSKEEA